MKEGNRNPMKKAVSKRRAAMTAMTAMAAATVLLLGACNTVQGVGRDIESAGRAGDKIITGD